LRLTVPNVFGRLVVLPLLTKYLAAWPDIQVEVSFTDRVADIVEEGFDLAVRIAMTTSDTRLVSRLLAKYKAVLCAAILPIQAFRHLRGFADIVAQEKPEGLQRGA
jgi:DNA-binding transcriptional LysR family regulator